MTVLYITSDRPAAGKTALAAALAAQLSLEGRSVGYIKPFSSAPQEDADVAFINGDILSREDGQLPPVPSPMPESALEGQPLPESTVGEVRRSVERLAATKELVLVEGPSLLFPEGDASSTSMELAELLDARVMLMMQYGPDLKVERVLEACEPFGQRLLGVLMNCVTPYRERKVRLNLAPAIEARGVRFLGIIPEDRLMESVTVGQIAQHLEGQWAYGQEKAQDLVEHFLIGGNIMDRGTTYFGRMVNKAVIVRGDRPDIQLAALSTPTTCLVLTGGHEPIQYVYYQAEQQEVPLLVVQADTITTAHALDTVLMSSTFHHPRKLERFQELIRQHADLAAIQEA